MSTGRQPSQGGRGLLNMGRRYAAFNNEVDLPLSEEPYYGVMNHSTERIGPQVDFGSRLTDQRLGGLTLGAGSIGSYFSGPSGGYLPNMTGYRGPATHLSTNWTPINWGPGAAAQALPAGGGGFNGFTGNTPGSSGGIPGMSGGGYFGSGMGGYAEAAAAYAAQAAALRRAQQGDEKGYSTY